MEGWLEPTLRFAHYALLLGLFGWTAFRLIGLRGIDPLSNDVGVGALVFAAIAAPLVSIALMLVSIAAMMGLPVAALDRAMFEAMISSTDMGTAFVVRMALLAAGLCSLLMRRRSKSALHVAAVLFAAALMTLGWNGHAAATEGLVGLLHRFNNGVHLVAAGLWLGAVSWFLRLTVKVHIQQDQMAAKALLVTMHRFAPLGVSLVVTIAITGLVNSQMIFGLVNSGEVLKSEYGVLLLAKLVLVGGMLTFGARNAAVARRVALAQDGRKIDTYMALAALRRSLIGEFIMAGLVIAVVAIVGMMSPVPM